MKNNKNQRGVIGALYMRFLKKYVLRLEGSVLPLAAIVFPVLLGSAGLGVDFSYWMMHKRNLQTAVDAAALAAAWEGTQGNIELMEGAARNEAANNGVNFDAVSTFEFAYDNDTGVVDVTIRENTTSWLGTFFSGDSKVAAYAAAQVFTSEGDYCILSLDNSATGAIKTSGSAVIDQPRCGLAANSRSNEALQIGGSADVTIGNISLRGGYNISGGSGSFWYENMYTRMPQVADPYVDLEVPEYTPCTRGQVQKGNHYTKSATLSPGVYCGGINITGNNDIHFEPGVYILDGGDFSTIGGGSLYGDGVTFILTNSGEGEYGSVNISGGRNVYFGAPNEGEVMEGVVFYQDRNAPTSSSANNKLTGTSELILDGVAYFPSQGVEFGGNDMTGTPTCSKVIAKTVTLSGNPRLDNDCTGKGTAEFAPPTVRLIM